MKILLIGAGKMGQAMMAGWQKNDLCERGASIFVIDPFFSEERSDDCVNFFADISLLPQNYCADYVVIAVKPHQVGEAMNDIENATGENTIFISVAAGKSTHALQEILPKKAKIARAMPNTSAMIQQAITAIYFNEFCNEGDKEACEKLLGAIGETAILDDEDAMDAVTAVSGSGPAYVFYFIEALKKAGMAQGLSEKLAHKLALQTVRGAGNMAVSAGEDVAVLRKNVTSPNGTTEKGLAVLMDGEGGLAPLLEKTVAAAANRSRELR